MTSGFVERVCFAQLDFEGNGSVEFDRMRKFFEGSLVFVAVGRRQEEDRFLKSSVKSWPPWLNESTCRSGGQHGAIR